MQVDMETTIDRIRYCHRQRCYAMEQRKRADLSLGSYLRTQLGWRTDNEASKNAAIRKAASDLITCGEKLLKGKPHPLSDTEEYREHMQIIEASVRSREPWDDIEAAAERDMATFAKSLPIWTEFAEPVKGLGAVSLAVIIGEAGDIGHYETHSKLWKRMGVAVMGGVRQGGLLKSAKAADWIAHGYSRQRRSRLFVIGDVLIKANGDGRYRSTYLARKEYERKRAEAAGLIVAPAAKIPAKRASEFMSDGHIHRRAQRYMEKRLLRDMWKAWRRAIQTVASDAGQPGLHLPASEVKAA